MKLLRIAPRAKRIAYAVLGMVFTTSLLYSANIDFHSYKGFQSMLEESTSFLPPCTMAPTEIGGTVYREFEHNGIADAADVYRFAELGYGGVTVNIYDDNQVLLISVTSDPDGTWLADASGASGSKVMVEFVSPTEYKSGPSGSNNSTAEVIVDIGTCNNDFTLGKPEDHCQDNPTVATACFPGPSSPSSTIVTIDFEDSNPFAIDQNTYPYPGFTAPESTASVLADDMATGFVAGIAWDKTHRQILSSSFMKLSSAGSTNNTGNIYTTTPTGTTTVWLDLEAVPGFADVTGSSEFGDGSAAASSDADVHNIGYIDFTDIEINEDDSEVYLFNAHDRSVYIVQIDPSTGAAIQTGIKVVQIPAICAGDNANGYPYAAAGGLGYFEGRVYATTTCTGPTVSDLEGSVHSFDPSVLVPVPVQELTLDYASWVMPYVLIGGGDFGNTQRFNTLAPWSIGLSNVTFGSSDFAPWAMDIEFDIHPDGKRGMNIVTKNRGIDTRQDFNDPTNGGYMSKASQNMLGGWDIEVNGITGPFSTGLNSAVPANAADNIFQRGQDDATFYHGEGREGPSFNGSALVIPGFKEVMTANTDDILGDYDSGFTFHDLTNGLKTRAVNLLQGSNVGFAKGNSWGDLQAMCALPPIEIGNYVWLDVDKDGFQDPSELPQAGVEVELWKDTDDDGVGDLSLGTATTNAQGYYFFGGVTDANTSQPLLPFMTYELRISLANAISVNPLITDFTTPDNTTDQFDSDYQDTLIAGDIWAKTTVVTSNTDLVFHQLDAGLFMSTMIGDTAFVDLNSNGLQDPMEPGIEGVTVTLFSATTGLPATLDINGDAIVPIMTNAAGYYKFTDLLADDYYVVFNTATATSGLPYIPTLQNVNGTTLDPADSDIDALGFSDTTTLALGQMDCTLDAGYTSTVAIGDTVFVDSNGNGLQDPMEPGIANVEVTLYDGVTGLEITTDFEGNMLQPTFTDANGYYKIDSLLSGSYFVVFDVSTSTDPSAADFLPTFQNINGGTLDADDSDIDALQTSDTTVILLSSQMDCTLDAGYFAPISIGDTVFVDVNGNGLQDPMEAGIPGVSVELYKLEGMTGVLQTTDYNGLDITGVITDMLGYYKFENLAPGQYYVIFDVTTATDGDGANYVATSENTNGSVLDPNDSDINSLGFSDTTAIVTSGNMDCTLDAGYFVPVSVGDSVFVDNNGNGIQDPFDSPLQDVVVTLFVLDDMGNGMQVTEDAEGNPVSPQLSNPDGTYSFDNLPPGEYYVEFDVATNVPDGADYVPTFQNTGMNDNIDSDVNQMFVSDTTNFLESNDEDPSLDAGFFIPVSIGDTVFVDSNFNGLQDDMEPVLEGVTVSLFDTSGTQILLDFNDVALPTQTDANGYYKFENLPPNQYYVVFDVSTSIDPMAASFVPTTQNVAMNTMDELDSDINTAQVSDTTEVASGGMDCTLDAGYFAPVSVGDTVFVDNNGNGLQDPGEPGIEGVPVTIFDAPTGMEVIEDFEGNPLPPTLTNADGYYKIDSLIPGQYYVVFDVTASTADPDAADYLPTMQNINGTALDPDDSDIDLSQTSDTTAILASGEMDCTLDAGYFVPVSVGDTAWVDDNGNGIFDDGEDPLPGVEVSLYKIIAGDSVLQTVDYLGNDITGTVTDAGGVYTFDTLMPGIYYVQFMEPMGSEYTLTTPEQGGDDTVDSDPGILTGTSPLTDFLESGDTDSSVDAGFFIPVSVGDTVFVDVNGDGLQDDDDTPMEGAEVTLFQLNDMGVGVEVTLDADLNAVMPMITGPDGRYKFVNLPPGEYYVEFDLTAVTSGADYVATVQNEGMDGNVDSDVALDAIDMTLRSDTTNFLTSDTMDCALDAGFFIPVSVGDTVFVDVNGNGLQDIGEPGILGVTVTLFRYDSVTMTSTEITEDFLDNDISDVQTDNNGRYKFENLQPGQYYVEFDVTSVVGADYYPTFDNINGGSLNATDSDISEDGGMLSDTTEALTSGGMDCTLDAGFFETVAVGDTAFVDANLDGLQDPTDPGLSGIEVTLFVFNPDSMAYVEVTENVNGTPVTPMLTGPDGSYLFDSLPPGLYFVNFDSNGIPITIQDVNNNMNDDTDSDIDELGNSDTLLVTSGMTNTSFDAGYQGLDYGDLPNSYVTADSASMNMAPKHVIREYKYLGQKVDQDIDGAPTADGQGDDNTDSPYILPAGQTGGDDEDGIEFLSPMIPGNVAYLKLTYTTPDSPAVDDAFLNAWIDFDGDGVFSAADAVNFTEVDAASITATTNLGLPAAGVEAMVILTFEVPETAVFANGNAYSRFRYSCAGMLAPDSGLALDGEIEDYVTPLGKIGNLVWLDENFDGLQDAADPEQVLAGIQVVLSYDVSNDVATINIQDTVVTDANGLYSFCGLISSDDAFYQLTVITQDGLAASMPNIMGNDSIDSDNDIEFGEEGRDSVQTQPFMITDVTMLPIGETGQADAPNIVGTFPDNQVNQTYDFAFVPIDFGDLPEMDFGDLPINYATTEDGNVDPPRHIVTSNKRLGACVDSELDGQPDPMGMGDDDNMDDTDDEFSFGDCSAGSDEDGIEFLTPLIPGDTAYIKVTYTLPPGANPALPDGFLNGWIDFDGNGILLNSASLGPNSNDQIRFFETTGFAAGIQRPNLPLEAGSDVMKILGFEVPETATFNGGTVFSRFRLSCEGSLLPVGILAGGIIPEGEVEDYVVPLTKIGNLVWLDQNYDGIQDTSLVSVEEGIANVPVSLTYTYVDGMNGIDLTIQVDTVTDENGKYNFCGLLPTDVGEYEITVITPDFLTPTVANNPSVTDSLDSDHAVNMGDSIVTTDIFQIPTSTGLPLMEDGIEDDPNILGTFPDSLFDQTYDFGFVPLDYGDLDSTYITAIEDGGPVHVISEIKYLGQGADAERTAAVDSIAGALADGDDNTPGFSVPSDATITDDEDGVKFITPLIPGYKATISVNYTLAEEDGFLNGWIDYNGNGMFEAAEALEFYSTGVTPDTDGALSMAVDSTVELCFDVPADAIYNEGDVHARFRLSCEGGLEPIGGFPVPDPVGPQAPQGEVEDYFIPLAKIGNLAFFDNNLDGSQDGNVGTNPETGVAGVNHILAFAGPDGAPFDNTDFVYPFTTDANGNYYVCGLIEGDYNIVPTKYDTSSVTPEDTIPSRYILTIPNNDDGNDDDLDSDFMPNLMFSVPNLLLTDLPIGEDGFTDIPGSQGFPDEQDQINFDEGWIPEPNIEAIANIAGVDFPESGACGNFNVIADVCIQNTGFIEMNGELIGARLEMIDIDINLGEQFMGAFIGVVGDPIILDTVEYEDAFMLVNDDDRPNENPDFDGNDDIDGSLMDGILEPSEIVCLRITFEIRPDELSDEDAMNLQFNAVVSGNAINNEGEAIPDFFNGGAQYMAVDSSDRMFMFDGTFDDPNNPEPLGDCYETSKDLSQQPINLSYDEECMALVTPQMVLTQFDENCTNDEFPLGGYYRLQLEDLNGGVLIPFTDSLILDDPAYIGNMYNIVAKSVADICNSSWAKVTVENKFDPVIACLSDTITCGELIVLAPPSVLNNCGEINLKLVNRTTMDVACDDPELQVVITETWEVTDPSGVRMSSCTQTLSIEKFDISEVVGPMTTDTTLNCSVGTMPTPAELGVPTLNGVDLYPDNFADCGIFVDFVDEFFDFGNNCTNGVQRTWTVQNWICGTDNSATFTQLITLVDTTGPVITNVPADMTVSTSGSECEATVIVPAIGVTDACNPDDIRVDINYEGGFTMNQNGDTIMLQAGTSAVTYVVYDVCGNSSTATFNVTVQDLEQPVTICDAFTTVSLNTEGKASLSAAKLDNGSLDECGAVTLEIRRMDDNLGFMDAVDFTCADIGRDNITVVLRVTDVSGNTNQCMAEVTIQDKIPPVMVSSLPDVTISCDFPFSMDNLSVFGTIVNDVDSIKPIIIDDAAVQFSGPAQDALIIDNCSTAEMSEITSGDLDQCGKGTLIRTLTATSPNGESVSIQQRISLVNPSPFVETDITWPADITLSTCGGTDATNPNNLPVGQNFPQYVEDNCDMVSSTFEDKVIDGGGCMVIERTWFVSDWCQRVDNVFVIFEDVQIITINNSVAPEITSTCADVRVESLDANCGDAFVDLAITATDDCLASEDLLYSYEIDAFSNGNVDITGTTNDASGMFPVGIHKISYIVGDGCGNVTGCSFTFEVVNVKSPSPKCFQGLSTNLAVMDTLGMNGILAMVSPEFFDAGSDHPCFDDLQLSFSADVNDTLKVFECGDIGQQGIQLWVTAPNGAQDFCATFIIVEDNNNLCSTTSTLVDITGSLFTEDDVELGDVEVKLEGSDFLGMTDESGHYAIADMPKGGDYAVKPGKDIEHLNGVSTLDLLLIQRHILGITNLDSPYKLLAADINKNGTITGSDLLQLRKLILGLYDAFPENTSWRFIDATHTFLDPIDPWSQEIPEDYEIYDLSSNMVVDFYGLKVGDVNGSVQVNGSPINSERRSVEQPFMLTYDDQLVKEGQTVIVPFYGDSINSILGYQFTMNIDARDAHIAEVISMTEGFEAANFGERYLSDGNLTSSWGNVNGLEVKEGAALFGIKLIAKHDIQLSEVITLSSEITKKEAYSKKGQLIELKLGLREEVPTVSGTPELFQNEPNPWITNTMISFRLPEATQAQLRIYDVAGKLLREHAEYYEAGVHDYKLTEEEFAARGVYYYELITDGYRLSKKMVLIK